MDSKWLSPCIYLFIFSPIWIINLVHCQSNIAFMVTDSGAISDGKTDNKQVFLSAWKKACQTNGGMLVIPPGTYLVSDVEFAGPCNGQTKVLLNGTLKAYPHPTLNLDYWIMFRNLNSLTVYGNGNGTFDGNGALYWMRGQIHPTLTSIKFEYVTNALIQDINSVNSKMFHISLHNSQHLSVNNVDISAPYNSTNTDGIHIGVSNDIRITNAHIATGDDCISLGDGSTNINITGVYCGPGHGISIGSLGRYAAEKDVSLIAVRNCTLTNTDNGLRIKTVAPSPPSMASAITFEHIMMQNVKNPIIIDQHYCPYSNCTLRGGSNVLIKNVKFIDVRGSSNTAVGVKIGCSESRPCQDIELRGVNLTFKGQPTIASCSYADVKFLGANQVPSHCS